MSGSALPPEPGDVRGPRGLTRLPYPTCRLRSCRPPVTDLSSMGCSFSASFAGASPAPGDRPPAPGHCWRCPARCLRRRRRRLREACSRRRGHHWRRVAPQACRQAAWPGACGMVD